MKNFLRENWFKIAILLLGTALLLSMALPGNTPSVNNIDQENIITTPKASKETRAGATSNIDLYLAFRNECRTEYSSVTTSMDEHSSEGNVNLAILLGQKTGVLDKDNYVVDEDVWVEICIKNKFDM